MGARVEGVPGSRGGAVEEYGAERVAPGSGALLFVRAVPAVVVGVADPGRRPAPPGVSTR
ncbi:MAG: hypothetical protein HY791_04490 [Deltaproteobacteria bacterium]|nr:hypothetical protein [Deltaproteobacteria bacterium]